MRFDSTELSDDPYFGAVRVIAGERGTGNSEETTIEFETPAGFAQPMEVIVLAGDNPKDERVYDLKDAHTIRIKITGEWEGGEILQGLTELIHRLKLKSLLLGE